MRREGSDLRPTSISFSLEASNESAFWKIKPLGGLRNLLRQRRNQHQTGASHHEKNRRLCTTLLFRNGSCAEHARPNTRSSRWATQPTAGKPGHFESCAGTG